MSSAKSTPALIVLLAIIKFALPFFLQDPVYQLHRDEYLYLAEAHHMSWGFMEIPPLLSVFAWISNVLGGSIVLGKVLAILIRRPYFLPRRKDHSFIGRKNICHYSWVAPFYTGWLYALILSFHA